MTRVERISENPLKAAQEEEERLVYEELIQMQNEGLDDFPTGMTAAQLSMVELDQADMKEKEKNSNIMQET